MTENRRGVGVNRRTCPHKGYADLSENPSGRSATNIPPKVPKSRASGDMSLPAALSDRTRDPNKSCFKCDKVNNQYMLQCNCCERWVHATCEEITQEDMKPFTKHETLPYICTGCRGGFVNVVSCVKKIDDRVTKNEGDIVINKD